MKAVYISEFDGPDGLELRDIDEPGTPTQNEVLVRVHAAGLNRADLLQARGLYPPPPGYSAKLPGLEFAGEVVEIGPAVTGWAKGDRVFGIAAGEGQAEFLTSDASLLSRIPDRLSYVEAAAVPEAFITAHDAIFTLGELQSGETLLIHAVGSGVGLAALQLAKTRGARVIGTSRTAGKLGSCAEFGLDVAITTEKGSDFASEVKAATDGRGVEVILDLVGAGYFNQNMTSLALKGRLVVVGLTSGAAADIDLRLLLQRRLSIVGTMLRGRSTAEKAAATEGFAKDVLPLLGSGRVRPVVDRVFAAADIIDAYKYLESNESFGKVILEF